MKLKLKNVRLTFPQLFEAKTVNGEGKPAFSANFLLDPADPQVKAINEAIEAVATEKWGAKSKTVVEALRKADKVCLHDGNLKTQYGGYEGNLYVSARSTVKPLVLDADKSPINDPSVGRPYSGCYVNASLELYAQDNNYGKRVNAVLGGIQFYRDGEAFAGGRAAEESDFDDVSEGASADDLS